MKRLTKIVSVICLAAISLSMVACSGKEVQIGGQEDLVGKVIGVQLGTTGDELAEEIDAKKVEKYNAYVDAITSLKQKKIDAIIMDKDTATSYVDKNEDLVILDVGFEPEQYAIAVPDGDTELKAVVDGVITAMKEDGSLEASLEAHAEETGEAPDYNTDAANGKLIMGTEAGFPPYEYMSGNNVIGTDVDLMAKVAAELDMELVVENMSFDGLIPALQQGKIDVIAAGMTINAERDVNVDFSIPYVDASQVVVIRKTSMK
jgi:polar amino acid transport system substrate-binding protein